MKSYFATYLEPFGRRVLYFGFGALLVLLGSSFPFFLYLDASAGSLREMALPTLLIATFLYCGVWLMATALRFRLILTERTLTLRQAFTTRTIDRKDIARCKQRHSTEMPALFLYSSRKKRAILRIPCAFEGRHEVEDWINRRL